MALSRRAKITAGVFGLTASALFAASGSAFAADQDGSGNELVIVEPAPASAVVHSPGDCAQGASTVADSR
jgi:hypothetical protein